jgi:hypothetical protein
MMKRKKWAILSAIGGVVLTLVITGAWLLSDISIANAAEITADELATLTQTSTGPGLLTDEGYLAHGGPGRGSPWGSIDYQQLLADALGITVDQLQAAYETARTAAIEQAVDEGLLTREQADELLVWGPGGMGRRFTPRRRADIRQEIDGQALLAEALGITVDELQAAREEANQAALAQAVEEGLITQEQADALVARRELQAYLNRDALLAEALGMTVDELQAAYDAGKTMTDLMAERDLDAATVRTRIEAAREAALAQAVEDGVITQEQADKIGSRPSLGLPRPFGRFGGRRPCPQGMEDGDGVRFQRPGRGTGADEAL